jgi:predicted nucleotidyltransferase
MDNKLKIINYLAKNKGKHTMHELSKTLNIPYATFYRVVKKSSDILTTELVGKSKLLSLNKESILTSHLAIASDEEKKEFLKKQPLINLIHKDLDTSEVVLLFGSYAKNKPKPHSDIDLAILNKTGNKSFSLNKLEILLNKEINPMFFSFSEFNLMLKDKEENVGKQILKNHIVLKNPQKFWEEILNEV